MKIGIIGTGALGIAFAHVLHNSNNKNEITLWTRFEQEKDEIVKHRENKKFFPGVIIDEKIKITNDISDLEEADLIIIAIPFVALTDVSIMMKEWYKGQIICSTTKGISDIDFKTSSEILKENLCTDKICALSGPSFAKDMVSNHPVHLMLGVQDKYVQDILITLFQNTNIHLHPTMDIRGIELAGAIKNAMAIGAGILDGLDESDSTKAAYLATAEQELGNILNELGACHETAFSYAGIGDLILTCTSNNSRNFTFGKLLGQGLTAKEAFQKLDGKTVEGYKIIRALHKFINEKNLNIETINILYDIVFNEKNERLIIR